MVADDFIGFTTETSQFHRKMKYTVNQQHFLLERGMSLQSVLLVFGLFHANNAVAADSWTNVAPGIDWLHRVESGSFPKDLHVVKIDMTNPLISFQASNGDIGTQTKWSPQPSPTPSVQRSQSPDWGASSSIPSAYQSEMSQ